MSRNDFVTQLKALIKEQINNVHTALPGEIVAVDSETGLAKVKPKAQMTFSNGQTLNFPVITNVPLVFPCSVSAGASIAFPVKAGDQCLIVFSEQSIEYWLGSGKLNSELRHSLSGAIAIPGLMRGATEDFSEAIEEDSVIIRNQKAKITLSNDAIAIRGDVTIDGNLSINGTITEHRGVI